MAARRQSATAELFEGPGQVRALCRSLDWSQTRLGPVAGWSPSLTFAVRLCLECKSAMALWVGEEFTLIHNDGYSAVLANKFPGAVGRPLREVWPEVVDQLQPEFERVRNGESIRHEQAKYRLLREGQEAEGYFVYSLTPLRDVDLTVIGVFNVVEETTAFVRARIERERQFEEQVRLFEAVTSTTPDFVYVFDRQGRFVYANRRLLEVWGMEAAEALGRTCREIGYEQWHHDMHMREIAQVIATRRPIKGEVPFKAPRTGIAGIYEYIFTPVIGPGGEVELIAGTTRDVTERKRGEEALRESEARLVEADQRKNHFIAVLSHELRNPLTPIKSSLYILDRAPPGGEQARRATDVIKRQIDQLCHLVDDLLDVTRITRGKIHLQRRRLELNELVRRTVDDHRSLFQTAQVQLELETAAQPVFVDADWNRTAQVVGNLLQNSAKFTPAGGRVVVTVEREAEAGQAVIRVVDTGIGMKQELLPRLFQPFMQADETLDRSKGGLGLGLALIKGIVEQQGGSIEARSEGLERGSAFVVRLPLVSAPAESPEAVAPAGGRSHRVLIIEDNEDAAQSLKEVLELQGHEVAVAHDGPAGLAIARADRPDLVLCDLGLPGMDGYEVARAFKADQALRGIHLIALSGYALPEDLRTATEAGFERHLAKPPNLEKLESVLAQV